MTKVALTGMLGLLLAVCLHTAPAQAFNNKSWVSSTGGGATCTRGSPCATFQAAHDQTNAGGEIGVVDSGDYSGSGLVINRAISIIAEGVDATILSPGLGSAAITISGSMIPTDVVTLQGLIIDGLGSGGIGISYPFGPSLVVKNCVIRNFKNASGSYGIAAQPNAAGRLTVTDTLLVNNGLGSTGAGIFIKPQPGGSVEVSLERVTVANNVFGIAVDGTGSTNGINMTVSDSVMSGNSQDGIVATTPGGGAPIGVMVKNTRSVNNNIGIRSLGTGVTVRVSNSTVIGNGTGLSFGSAGALLSFGNNEVQANGVNGAFSGSVALQ
jgi:hypothetical protein